MTWPFGIRRRAAVAAPSVGFTDFGTHTNRFFVSSSTGNNANNGLTESTPKQTIAAGKALMTPGQADWLMLKAGDTFTETSGFQLQGSGPSSGGWARMTTYGTGPRAKIDFNTSNTCIVLSTPNGSTPMQRFALDQLELIVSGRIAAGAATTSTANAISVLETISGGAAAYQTPLFEDLLLTGFAFGIVSGSSTLDLAVKRSIFHRFWQDVALGDSSGILNSGVDTHVDECVFYMLSDPIMAEQAAWSARTHSMYLGAEGSSYTSRNISIRAPEGSMQRSIYTAEQNFAAWCHFTSWVMGQANGVTPHNPGLHPQMLDNLFLDNPDGDALLGNIGTGAPASAFARNMVLTSGSIPGDVNTPGNRVVLWGNANGTGSTNAGVHNTAFTDNYLSRHFHHQHAASNTAPHYSGNTFTGNTENMGAIADHVAAFMTSIGESGDLDDYGDMLVGRGRGEWESKHSAVAPINFWRAEETALAPL